jgi:DNA-binding PadR family transcriptional regulator
MSTATESPQTDLACAIGDCREEITDGLILAALERAERQTGSSEVWLRVFVEHLGFEPRAPTSRRLRPDLGYLCHAGLLRRGEAKGREYWSLTAEGREELARSRAADVIGELPESPQHRAWREARMRARAELPGFRRLVHAVLGEARELSAGYEHGASLECFELAELLSSALWLLGSATHCLAEWQEPEDHIADVDRDPGPAPGRRAVSAWRAIAVKAKGGEA